MQVTFAKVCKIAVFILFFAILIPLNLVWQNHTQFGASRKWTVCFPNSDFSQYYLAGTAARYGLWDKLYPTFKPEWADKPGRKIWSSLNADADPQVLSKVSGLAVEYVENCGPPPQALFCLPLSYFTFTTAFKIWMTGLILATWGTLICAVKIYRRLGGTSGYVEGTIYLIGGLIPLLPRLGAGDNVMMFTVLCAALVALTWGDQRPFLLGSCLIIPAIFKGLTVSWCPLLLIKPVHKRTLIWMAVCTLVLNGVILLHAGMEPYLFWLHHVLPDVRNMDVQQYWAHSANLKGIAFVWGWEGFPAVGLRIINLAGLLAIYFAFWKKRNCLGPESFANICAAIVAALVLFNLCNAVSWLPYVAYLLPFAGWAVMEYEHCSPLEKHRLKWLAGALLLVVPFIHLLLARFVLHRHISDAGRDLYIGVELMFLVLAFRRLYSVSPAEILTGRKGAELFASMGAGNEGVPATPNPGEGGRAAP